MHLGLSIESATHLTCIPAALLHRRTSQSWPPFHTFSWPAGQRKLLRPFTVIEEGVCTTSLSPLTIDSGQNILSRSLNAKVLLKGRNMCPIGRTGPIDRAWSHSCGPCSQADTLFVDDRGLPGLSSSVVQILDRCGEARPMRVLHKRWWETSLCEARVLQRILHNYLCSPKNSPCLCGGNERGRESWTTFSLKNRGSNELPPTPFQKLSKSASNNEKSKQLL